MVQDWSRRSPFLFLICWWQAQPKAAAKRWTTFRPVFNRKKRKVRLRVNSLIVDHHKFLYLLFLFMRDGPLMSEFKREAGMAVYASMHWTLNTQRKKRKIGTYVQGPCMECYRHSLGHTWRSSAPRPTLIKRIRKRKLRWAGSSASARLMAQSFSFSFSCFPDPHNMCHSVVDQRSRSGNRKWMENVCARSRSGDFIALAHRLAPQFFNFFSLDRSVRIMCGGPKEKKKRNCTCQSFSFYILSGFGPNFSLSLFYMFGANSQIKVKEKGEPARTQFLVFDKWPVLCHRIWAKKWMRDRIYISLAPFCDVISPFRLRRAT